MTATATASVRADARLGFGGVLRSEWIKFTSLRSTYWTSAVILLLWVGLALLMSSTGGFTMVGPTGEEMPITAEQSQYVTVLVATSGSVIAVLVAGIQGVLSISGEYSTGMIRSSLTAVPGRLAVLAGKAVVTFAWTFLLGAVSITAAYLVALPFLGGQGIDGSLDGDVLLAFLGAAVYLGFVSLFGLGIGTLVRSAAGGIAIVVGVLLVLTTVLGLLSMSIEWIGDLSPYLLSNAGGAMSMIEGNPFFGEQTLEPIGATLVTAVWPVAALAIGAVALKGRDA
jgi:ABC-2 type transport system permease protein